MHLQELLERELLVMTAKLINQCSYQTFDTFDPIG